MEAGGLLGVGLGGGGGGVVYEGFWGGVFECFEVWCGKGWVEGRGFVGVWCLVFCGGNWGGEVLCNVGRGTLVEVCT